MILLLQTLSASHSDVPRKLSKRLKMGNKSAVEIWKLKYADEIFLDFLKAMMLIIEIISNCVVNIFVGVFFF